MRIPEVREAFAVIERRLAEKALDYSDLELLDMVKEMIELRMELYRKPAVKRAKAKARHVDEKMREFIREWYAKHGHPDMAWREIGAQLGVDGARVSEAIGGFRE